MSKAQLLNRMPRAFRPRLSADQRVELGICHWQHIDAIQSGQADAQLLWCMAGGTLTWSRVAEVLGTGIDEMCALLVLVEQLLCRFHRDGRLEVSAAELQTAQLGAAAMDALAEIVDRPTAIAAAEWSEAQVQRMADAMPVAAGEGDWTMAGSK